MVTEAMVAVQPVRRRSLVEQATSELSRLIASGEWPVGSRVPGEVMLSRKDIVADSTLRTPDEDAAVDAAHHALVDAIADGDTGAAVVATRRNVHATLVRLRGEP